MSTAECSTRLARKHRYCSALVTSVVDCDPMVAADRWLVDERPVQVTWRGVDRVPGDSGTWYTDVMTTSQYSWSTFRHCHRSYTTWQFRVFEHYIDTVQHTAIESCSYMLHITMLMQGRPQLPSLKSWKVDIDFCSVQMRLISTYIFTPPPRHTHWGRAPLRLFAPSAPRRDLWLVRPLSPVQLAPLLKFSAGSMYWRLHKTHMII